MSNGNQPSNPLLTMAVNLVTNPWVLAGLGGAAGYYFFGRKDGKTIEGKRPYIAAGVGAAAGLAAGKIIQSMRMNQAAQLQAQQAAAQVSAGQQPAPGMDDYYMGDVPDVDAVFNQPPPGAHTSQQPPMQEDIEDTMGLGSLDGTSLGGGGLGSFAREDGFDAYDPSIEEAIRDAKKFN